MRARSLATARLRRAGARGAAAGGESAAAAGRGDAARGRDDRRFVHVSIRADALLGDDVTVPQQTFALFEATPSARVEPSRDGRQTYVFDIDLLALEPGEHTLAGAAAAGRPPMARSAA